MMAMVQLQASLRRSSLVSGKLRMLKRKLTPRWKRQKLLRRIMRPRCEGVERCVVEHNFCKKYFGPFESSYILRYGLSFFCEYTSQY
jgi:hypothetical protein